MGSLNVLENIKGPKRRRRGEGEGEGSKAEAEAPPFSGTIVLKPPVLILPVGVKS